MQTVLQGQDEDEVADDKAQQGSLFTHLTTTPGDVGFRLVPYVDSDDVCTSSPLSN